MFSNETIRKLREIHMGVMAEQLSAQLEDPQFRNVPFAVSYTHLTLPRKLCV